MKTEPNYTDSFSCDICGKKRSIGNHAKCSQLRRQRYATENAKSKKAR